MTELNPIYKKAKKRVQFKIHALIYLLVLLFLWIVWYFIFTHKTDSTFFDVVLFLTLAWSILLIGHYFISYRWNHSLIENEIKVILKKYKTELTDQEISDFVENKEKN
jgi:membrane protease YdiL (CAAX protease family)